MVSLRRIVCGNDSFVSIASTIKVGFEELIVGLITSSQDDNKLIVNKAINPTKKLKLNCKLK
jgi:hypothetical protein